MITKDMTERVMRPMSDRKEKLKKTFNTMYGENNMDGLSELSDDNLWNEIDKYNSKRFEQRESNEAEVIKEKR